MGGIVSSSSFRSTANCISLATVKRLALLILAGCSYHPNAFSDIHGPFDGHHQTIGCLDLAVDNGEPSEGPVVSYAFGNRCRYPVPLDLTAVHVRGHSADGVEHELIAFDPNHELRPLELDALLSGRENIEYVGAGMTNICIDLTGITNAAPQQAVVCQ
jgi:hypothetical protein